jgi:hypothetical protein
VFLSLSFARFVIEVFFFNGRGAACRRQHKKRARSAGRGGKKELENSREIEAT